MANRDLVNRSFELKPVPEYDKLSNSALPAQLGKSQPSRTAGSVTLARDGGDGNGGGQGAGASRLGRQGLPIGRASIVLKQTGRQLIDLGRLQANWLKDTLGKKSDAQDYVSEEDQGIVALLARHVDVSHNAWQQLMSALGTWDGQFFQSGYGPAPEPHRGAVQHGEQPDAAEAGQAAQHSGPPVRKSVFGLKVIHPYNLFAVLWTVLILLLDLFYTAFWVPINVAFCTAEYGQLSSGCTSSEFVGGMLYFINALVGFQIGVVATHGFRKRTVVDGRLVAWLYAWYGRFWLDFVGSVPFIVLVILIAARGHIHVGKSWVNCLSLLRLLRLVRLVSISRVVYMDALSGSFQDSAVGRYLSVTVIHSVFLAYQLAVVINLLACGMVLCAYFEGYDKSWMAAVDWAGVPTAHPLYQWYCAVYWMIVTATTTGFGDFQPRSIAEQVVANVGMVGGMILFGVLVASIGNALSRATAEAHQAYTARRRIMHVLEWAEGRNLAPDIRKQVLNFYSDKYGRKEEEVLDEQVMSHLPSRLRAKVARAMCLPLIADVHILLELPQDLQALIAENMRPQRLPAGEDLCQQGDVADCLWILQEGTIEAVRYREGSQAVEADERPRLLGESVLLGDSVEACRVRPWTLRTVTPCRLWGITVADLYPIMRLYPTLGLMAAEYVKIKTVYSYNGFATDDDWCELVAIMVRQLQERMSVEEAQGIVQNMVKASAEEGSLQPLLDHLLGICTTRRGGVQEEERDALATAPSGRSAMLSPQGSLLAPGASTAFSTLLPGSGGRLGAGAPFPFESAESALSPFTATGAEGGGPPAGAAVPWVAAPAGAVQCSGCQRCVCPSCGQGIDATQPAGAGPVVGAAPFGRDRASAVAAAAYAAALAKQGVNSRPTAGPAIRSWVNRAGTLRRQSIGPRPDQMWVGERRSRDTRQLGAMSIVPTYD
ncbi:hypothetical protein Agub_g10296 [Astrephomene gubernaculifera]|uniref:Cyclic nucleotide-binding domain-containing protein n=1 Tax=Astrephomene gubernaculifera TaxID=47775 RepID=A0AAD3DX77_9CHLO|nr:hypothetical protein Agub_g10296 [Astrephomene gubernaculifera]